MAVGETLFAVSLGYLRWVRVGRALFWVSGGVCGFLGVGRDGWGWMGHYFLWEGEWRWMGHYFE